MATHFRFLFISSVLAASMIAGCSDDEKKLLPCPPDGLGVAEFEGVSPIDQMENWSDYACSEPQICPDEGIAFIGGPYVITDDAAPAPVTALLRNCSTGNQKLIIDDVLLYGDTRCSFTCSARVEDPNAKCSVSVEDTEIAPGDGVIIQILYKPTEVGEDHAQFRVFSNAQNFNGTDNPLNIGMCSRAQSPSNSDSSSDDDAGVADASAESQLICDPAGSINTTCHED